MLKSANPSSNDSLPKTEAKGSVAKMNKENQCNRTEKHQIACSLLVTFRHMKISTPKYESLNLWFKSTKTDEHTDIPTRDIPLYKSTDEWFKNQKYMN